MLMRFASATHPAGMGSAGAGRFGSARAARARREHGEFLGELRRAAMRALRPFPLAGAHEHFAVLLAFLAMKFVNRHGKTIISGVGISRGKCAAKVGCLRSVNTLLFMIIEIFIVPHLCKFV